MISNDNEFLNEIITVVDMLIHQFGYNNMVCIKDINGRYVYASNSYIKLILSPRVKRGIIGKTDKELEVFPETNYTEIGEKEDHEVIQENHMISFLKIYPYPSGTRPLIFNKATLINKKTGNIIGIIIRVTDISVKNLASKILEIHQVKIGSQTITEGAISYNLTPREQQVIFLFMANFSSPDIAKIISQIEDKSISKSYIDKVFTDQLYVKFMVHDRKALFDKLYMLKLDDHLPSLFT